jgi:hypothetical protein
MNRNIESKVIKEKRVTPDWLYKIVGQNYLNDLGHIGMDMLHCKTEDLLKDSCFYYCSGADITPIIAFEGYVHSFIYSDNCEYQNYDDSLSKLKYKLRKQEFEEIQKSNIDLGFFRLHKSELVKIELSYSKQIRKPIPSGEFSIWKKGSNLFSLLYLCWDDICVWKNLYEGKVIYPTVICAWQPEDNNMTGHVITEGNLPRYLIGHSIHIGKDLFTEIGKIEYFGDYAVDESGCIPLYEKRANR